MYRAWAPLTLILVFSSCGSSSDGAAGDTDTDVTSGNEQAATISTAENWEALSHGDKMAWMDVQVVPHMQALFQEFDSERYGELDCATCHGEGASERNFAMPSASLPALHPTGTDEQRAMVSQYGPMVQFMFQRVLPDMQTLVGAPDYDEETEAGFSCYSCHPHAGADGTTPISLEIQGEGEGDAAEEPDAG